MPASSIIGKLLCADWKLAGSAAGPPEPKSPSNAFNCSASAGQNQSAREILPTTALVVVFIFELKASWTDFLRPLIYIRDVDLFTLPRGLKLLIDQFSIHGGEGEIQLVMAAAVLVTLPIIIIFFLGQRYFVEGIATTGRKG